MSPKPPLTRGESLHLQFARHLRGEIENGAFRDGAVLPSTRELASEWGVSVFTINQAMQLLAAEGLVVAKSKSNRVVRSPRAMLPGRPRRTGQNVVLIGGHPGSGKSEFARALARETNWPVIDKDTITRPVVERALETLGGSPHDRESEIYLTTFRPTEHEALTAAVVENVECGNSVIATAPYVEEFRDAAWVERTTAHLDTLGARATLVWVDCDVDSMHSYLRRRGAARDAAKLADWPRYTAGLDRRFRPAGEHVLIENCRSSVPLRDQARALVADLRTTGA